MSDANGDRPDFSDGLGHETGEDLAVSLAIMNKKYNYSNSTIMKTINTKTPPPKETGYTPPKNKDKGKYRVPAPGARGETGWLDKKGNVWVPDIDMDGGEGWRRHYPDGSHDHVYPDGNIRSHNISMGTRAGVLVGVGAWELGKWGVAIFLAPETGGASIGGAAALP